MSTGPHLPAAVSTTRSISASADVRRPDIRSPLSLEWRHGAEGFFPSLTPPTPNPSCAYLGLPRHFWARLFGLAGPAV